MYIINLLILSSNSQKWLVQFTSTGLDNKKKILPSRQQLQKFVEIISIISQKADDPRIFH